MISLIILTYNNFHVTSKPCLDSLRKVIDNDFELIIVNNLSNDASRDLLSKYIDKTSLPNPLYPDKNLGYGGGMNLGCLQAKGDWLVLINSDTIFFNDSLKQLKTVLERTKNDIVGCLTNAAGTAQEIIKSEDSAFIAKTAEDIHKKPTQIEIPLIRADFFCCAIRKECWESLNGFDEIYGLGYYEDIDFSERAKRTGFKVGMTEDVFIAHIGGASFKGLSNDQKQLIKKNKAIFTKRFPDIQLLNTRDDNLEALNYYLRLLEHGKISEGMRHRLSLRLKRADENIPRSFFKKRRYKKKLMQIKENLARYI